MRFLIVSAVFPPEPTVSGRDACQVAQTLAQRGHAVQVLTAFPNRPTGKLYPGYRRRLYARDDGISGLKVTRCFAALAPESRLVTRFLENASFGITSGLAALLAPRPDAIYANTWPLFAAGLLRAVAALRRVPVVISVQDIYPESLLAQARLAEDGVIPQLMSALDGWIARGARQVIVISEQFAALYREVRRIPAGRIHVIPNWIEDEGADPRQAKNLRAVLGIPTDAFLLVYGGNVGVAAGVEGVIEALAQIPDAERPHLLIAGSGPRLAQCREMAGHTDARRIHFLAPWPAGQTAATHAAADALVLPTLGMQSLASVPSKLISYMLAERPIIAQADAGSDLAHIMAAAECGWLAPPGSPELLARAIREAVTTSPDERGRRGRAARAYALQHFTAAACLPQIVSLLEAVAREHSAPRRSETEISAEQTR